LDDRAGHEALSDVTRAFDVITFDCYGTLIDWETGIAEAFRTAAAADGVTLKPEAILQAFFDEPPAAQRPYATYREILTASAKRVGERLGWPVRRDRAGFLPDSVARWPPFPDTNGALGRLSRAGYELGILSNIDDDLLAGTRRQLTVPFGLLITAQQVRSYKPAPPHFTAARERIGGRRWLHAARSYFHDVTPAVAHGIPVAWINRRSERPAGSARANWEFPTLTELADHLA
jgi:2-haloacid dehalogenase/putative hydrolase of the HAD superfamily